jgi:BirA family biotin operon repressor/biotin-[acetyl-CoA-carboxylase] ligase
MTAKDEFIKTFRGDIIGKEVIMFESTVSTNDAALRIGRRRDEPEGIVVISDEQTGGRGRFDRPWLSPPGVNLYFSVVLRPDRVSGDVQLVTLAAGVAVASAIREYAGVKAEIKWPNDVLVNNRKVCGILVEMRSGGGGPGLLIVGTGVNVNMRTDAFSDDLRDHATSLKIETGRSLDRGGLFNALLSGLERVYKILLNGDKEAVFHEWYRLNCTIGQRVSVRDKDRVISGVADGINGRGELLVRLSSGEVETVCAGDVTIIK